MTEILTESFCERCGTRYTFEPVQSKRRALGKIGTLGRGFRHFVADPGSSLDEAFAVARSEQEQRSTTHALEAFHRTFNFCLNCRQYTCGDCWNAVEGRCLTCAPTEASLEPPPTRMDTAVVLPPLDAAPARVPIELGGEADLREAGPWIGGVPDEQAEPADMQPPAPDAAPAEPVAFEPLPAPEQPVAFEPVAEPELPALDPEPLPDLASAEAIDARLAVPPTDDAITGILDEPAAAPVEEPLAALEPVEAAQEETVAAIAEPSELQQVEPEAAQADAIEAEPAPRAAEQEPVAAVQATETPELPQPEADIAFEPGLNLDDQIAEYERLMAAGKVEPPAVGTEAPAVEPQPEPVAAHAEPQPVVAEAPGIEREPVAAEGQAAPATQPVVAETVVEPEPVPAAQPEPVAAQPEPIAAEPEPVVARPAPLAPQPEPVAAQPEPIASEPEAVAAPPAPLAPQPEPVAAEPVAPEPEPVAAEPQPVAAQAEPEPKAEPVAPAAPATPEPPKELPVAASKPTPPRRIEPIPTAIGTPLPASVVDGPLAWPDSDIAAAAFEQQWPDIPVPRRQVPETPKPAEPPPAQPPVVQQSLTPPTAAQRRTGAHLPSVSAPPPVLTARACPSCGLSLSASARFCRRCGTPQQVDAAR